MTQTSDRQKRILAKIYASQFVKGVSPMAFISSSLETDTESFTRELAVLVQNNLVSMKGGNPSLTPTGRKTIVVVMAGGSFDIIHPGHIETLQQARSLGDSLIVSVARDATFRKNKKREPQHNEALRQKLVSSLRVVDTAVLGSETDILETAVMLKPDIVALGYDQTHSEASIQNDLLKRGLSVKVVRLKSSIPEVKTSTLLKQENGNLLGSD
jgi:cytidyltransferase-like protein